MYRYEDLLLDLNHISKYNPHFGSIGKSLFGTEIPYIHTGTYKGKQLIVTGGIHARENLTSRLIMLQVEHSLINEKLLNKNGIYYIPMLNPDGVFLVEQGLELWKANGRGVDLNVNFDAGWGSGEKNTFVRGSENYIGEYPNSEVETRNLIEFTGKVKPNATISYHCKGREVYWNYNQTVNFERDRKIGEYIAKELNYRLIEGTNFSVGGYKDYCIEHFAIPSYTIEIIDDKYMHPLKDESLYEEIEANLDLPEKVLKML